MATAHLRDCAPHRRMWHFLPLLGAFLLASAAQLPMRAQDDPNRPPWAQKGKAASSTTATTSSTGTTGATGTTNSSSDSAAGPSSGAPAPSAGRTSGSRSASNSASSNSSKTNSSKNNSGNRANSGSANNAGVPPGPPVPIVQPTLDTSSTAAVPGESQDTANQRG